ncbi:MAG: methyltransferase domain-containing protein, partial [Bacteroidota bacterium]
MSDVLHNCPGCNGTEFTHLLDVEAQMHPSAEKFAFHQCTSCGMVMLNPRVKPERLHEYYTASYVPYRGPEAWGRYASFVASDQRQMDSNRLKKLRQHSRIDASHLILDIGCGKPSFLQKVHDSTGATCVGLDFSDLGWRDEPDKYEKLELQIGEVQDVTLARAPDIVTMWHYLEHDYHPDQTLHKNPIRRMRHLCCHAPF